MNDPYTEGYRMISLEKRCENYQNTFPKFPAPYVGLDNRLQGIWILGNDYRNKTEYYGAYPPNYLKRMYALFPDIINNVRADVLHLFSGSLKKDELEVYCKQYLFDIQTNELVKPDFIGNAEELSTIFYECYFDLIFADPPYSESDAEHYGVSLIHRNKVVKECYKVLKSNGFLVWLDQVLPMYRKNEFRIVGAIGLIRSTNHRFRIATIFQKIEN